MIVQVHCLNEVFDRRRIFGVTHITNQQKRELLASDIAIQEAVECADKPQLVAVPDDSGHTDNLLLPQATNQARSRSLIWFSAMNNDRR